MSCRELVELVTAYFEGELSWRQRRRFDRHIAACEYCSRYIEQMRVTITTLGRLDEESISPAAREALLGAFKNWHAGAQPLP
jgi:anti-sigma factor RsiW